MSYGVISAAPLTRTPIFETQFNNILTSDSTNPNTQLCTNKREDALIYWQRPDVRHDYPHRLGFASTTFHACRSAMIRNCSNPACVATTEDLKTVMPPCPTWPGLELWALQAAACFCSGQAENLGRAIPSVTDFITTLTLPHDPNSGPDVYTGKCATFTKWARQMNPWEVIPLLCWLTELFPTRSKYEDPMHVMRHLTSTMSTDGYRDRAIRQAISRARELHLCPHRVCAIAFSMPGQESNIPALVPGKHSLCSYIHNYCSTGPSHESCTYEYCEVSAVNFTNVVQCHRPACDRKCRKKVFPVHLLDKVASENRPTAWAIDGDLRPLESGERYMAISHVWSDGTGGSGSVNECMYNFFCDVARKLECKGLWWDAICIPQDKHARADAVAHMHEYYSQAACTVVHDTCLAMSEWVDGNHASFALVMSNWFTRGWTALELARSKQVEVVFGARGDTGYVLKNLDIDILSGPAIVSSMSRQAASRAIRSLRKNLQSEACYTLDDVLTALAPRFTSWAHDRAVIAGQFVGIKTLSDNQRNIYQQVVCKIGKISPDHLFHHVACPTGPFAWLPSSLFDVPISQTRQAKIEVLNDGSLLCEWGIILLPVNFQFSWDVMHPMLRCHVREALNDDRHIILFDSYMRSINRGLLVKVMKDTSPSYEILCHYVGPLHFATLPLDAIAAYSAMSQYYYSVLISSSGVDLDTGVSAANHIMGLEACGLIERGLVLRSGKDF